MSASKSSVSFVVLASGKGTNARALWTKAKENPELLKAVGLICDRADAPVLAVAKEFQIPSRVVSGKNEEEILAVLQDWKPSWACLAGYRRLVGRGFLEFFRESSSGYSRILNVHPSLLPAYPGLKSYEEAFRDGVKVSGITVHFVDSGLDTGKVILQKSFHREETDSLESFRARGLAIEHELFPRALVLAAKNKIHWKLVSGNPFVSVEEQI